MRRALAILFVAAAAAVAQVSSIPSAASGSGTSITLETNSTPNGSQSTLNLVQGSNVTLTDDGTGNVTVAAAGGGSGLASCADSSSSTTTYTSSCTATYANRLAIVFTPANTNTGAATLNVGAQGAKAIIRATGNAIGAGELQASKPYLLVYDGAAFTLNNDALEADGTGTLTFTRTGYPRVAGVTPGTFLSIAGSNTPTGYTNLSGGQIRLPETTVASLPAASSNTGKEYIVTDGATICDTSTGSGSTRVLVHSNGTSWVAPNCPSSFASISGLWSGTPSSSTVAAGDGTWKSLTTTAHDFASVATCVAASASGTNYTCSTSPTFTPASGDVVLFKADVANSGTTPSLNVNATSAITIRINGTIVLANTLAASKWYLLMYDGSNWQILSTPSLLQQSSNDFNVSSSGVLSNVGVQVHQAAGNANVWQTMDPGSKFVGLMADHQFLWRSASTGSFYSGGSNDTGISRIAAAAVGVGNGTQGTISGTLQAGVTATDPGCTTSSHIGKQWFDITTTTTAYKVCLNTAGTVGWVTK